MDKIGKNLFKLDAAGACGVLMPTEVMKKVVKLQSKYIQELKAILYDHKEELISYSWTMGWDKAKGGDSVYAYYIDKYVTVEERIKLFQVSKPIKVECFDTTDYDLVKKWCIEEYEKENE